MSAWQPIPAQVGSNRRNAEGANSPHSSRPSRLGKEAQHGEIARGSRDSVQAPARRRMSGGPCLGTWLRTAN
eukprot:3612079-Prymnesium_polylepis.1